MIKLAAFCILATLGNSSSNYELWFAKAEEAKANGDHRQMARSLERALAEGPGTEYAWRSLSWAKMHIGRWEEAIQIANENIQRHGETSWSLSQLFEAAMSAGDLRLAQSALDRESRLPADKRNKDMTAEAKELRNARTTIQFDLSWTIQPTDFGDDQVLRIRGPERRSNQQHYDISVDGAESWSFDKKAHREVLVLHRKDGQPIHIRFQGWRKPVVLGPKLESIRDWTPRGSAADCLGPFINGSSYDPKHPRVQALVPRLKGDTPPETVQNILRWLNANMKYEFGHSDQLDAMLDSGKGVCHHWANLMVTLCRACGVPALVEHGIAIPTEDGKSNGSHGWTKVWFNEIGWVPVEPLNVNSLRSFRGLGYLSFGTSGWTSDDNNFNTHSLQGFEVTVVAKPKS